MTTLTAPGAKRRMEKGVPFDEHMGEGAPVITPKDAPQVWPKLPATEKAQRRVHHDEAPNTAESTRAVHYDVPNRPRYGSPLKPWKVPGVDLARQYGLTMEIGFVVVLGLLLVLFQVPIRWEKEMLVPLAEQEVVQIEEVQQTQQPEQPPPPPRPMAPVAVADDVVLEDVELNLDASLDLDDPVASVTIPPRPPPVDEPQVKEEEPEIFIAVEEMPQLIGGIASIQQNIKYPAIARRAGVEGRVHVQFVVDEQGRPTDPVILRGIGAGCDEEAVRAIMEHARFTPGKQRGTPVRVRMAIPVIFRLRDAPR